MNGFVNAPIESSVEDLALWAYQTLGEQEFVDGKEEFWVRSGKVFPDDVFFDERMDYFLQYFLFSRPARLTQGGQQTPFGLARAAALQGTERITAVRHSIFEVRRLGRDQMRVVDLLQPRSLIVGGLSPHAFLGYGVRDILQGFVHTLLDEGGAERHFLGRGSIHHPYAVRGIIRKKIRLVLKGRSESGEQDVLSGFARAHMRHLRLAHIDVADIYRQI